MHQAWEQKGLESGGKVRLCESGNWVHMVCPEVSLLYLSFPRTHSCNCNIEIHLSAPAIFTTALQAITRGEIHESTISLWFLGIILRFIRLELSTFVFVFLQNAIHE